MNKKLAKKLVSKEICFHATAPCSHHYHPIMEEGEAFWVCCKCWSWHATAESQTKITPYLNPRG